MKEMNEGEISILMKRRAELKHEILTVEHDLVKCIIDHGLIDRYLKVKYDRLQKDTL